MSLTDQQIIDNTYFEVDDSERLICYTVLPGEDRFAQAVSSEESVRKNMIGWCNTVREYVNVQEQRQEEERIAKKARRGLERPPERPKMDAKGEVLGYFDGLQARIDELGEEISKLQAERKQLRDERDQLQPIVTVWRGE